MTIRQERRIERWGCGKWLGLRSGIVMVVMFGVAAARWRIWIATDGLRLLPASLTGSMQPPIIATTKKGGGPIGS